MIRYRLFPTAVRAYTPRQRAETAGREKERAQSCLDQCISPTITGPRWLAVSDSFGVGMEVRVCCTMLAIEIFGRG